MIDDFDITKLKAVLPHDVLEQVHELLQPFNITNKLRLAHFLAQCAHESGNFKLIIENLNYSAEGLLKTWPKRFPNSINKEYARQPERIANRAYANRLGNGSELTGDGYKYRGRGYIQLTGKNNYAAFSRFIGADCVANPDLVATKYPLASAAFFFDSNRLWKWCDAGSSEQDVANVTKRINGGLIGLSNRIKLFNQIYSLIK